MNESFSLGRFGIAPYGKFHSEFMIWRVPNK